MSNCVNCGQWILSGGKTVAGRLYCGERCLQADRAGILAATIPADRVTQAVLATVKGKCPICSGTGSPVGEWVVHRAISVVVMTYWRTKPMLCCAACGRGELLRQSAITLLFGWWGFPWGAIMTPIQLAKNLVELFSPRDHAGLDSAQLHYLVARRLAEESTPGLLPAALAGVPVGPSHAYRFGQRLRGWLRSSTPARSQPSRSVSTPAPSHARPSASPPSASPPSGPPSKRALARCQAHGLAYDSTQHAGCVVCRRS